MTTFSSPGAESEAAAYLQARLRFVSGFLAVCVAAINIAFRILDLAVHDWDPAHFHFDDAWRHTGYLACLITAPLYFALRRKRYTHAQLRTIDAVLFFSMVVVWVIVVLVSFRTDLYMQLTLLALLVVTRAVVVPSSGWRTFCLSLPVVPTALAVHIHWGPVFRELPFAIEVFFFQAVMLISVAVATMASRVNFGLRLQVYEAKRLGQYSLEEKIGEGGMGQVYRATHALLKRPTAIKILRPEIASPETLKRFEQEAQQAARLVHPNTVHVFDYGLTSDGVFYYAMELVDGADLERIIKKSGPLQPARVIHVLAQACGALDEAHATGLIHRDIKPANLMLCRRGRELDVVKVLDFGLVKSARPGDEALTQAGTFVGTPATSAPESYTNAELGPQADLYSLGIVGYYALAGTWPFDASAPAEFVNHHLNSEPIPLSQRGAAVPEDLEALILQCMEKNAASRPATAAALAEALRACSDAGAWTQEDARAWWESVEL